MTEGSPERHFAFAGRKLLLMETAEGWRVPDGEQLAVGLRSLRDTATEVSVSLPGIHGRTRVHELPADFDPPPGYTLLGLRQSHGHLTDSQFGLAGTALQKLEWLRTHRFCSRCGQPTHRHPAHEAMACPACDHLQFPRVAPAVIVLVERQREVLLARASRFPEGMYSTIAGFVEPGESLEEAVHREVEEEVGDLRYFGSQPWPFPHSLMVAFVARWTEGEIRVDDRELEDARWFPSDALPLLPPPVSIARGLVEDFLSRNADPLP